MSKKSGKTKISKKEQPSRPRAPKNSSPSVENESTLEETQPEAVAHLGLEGRTSPPKNPELSGGDVDAASDRDAEGEETVGGSHAMPDEDVVEELGKAVGVTYQDTEPLRLGEKEEERDRKRWELDPASSEDYEEHRTF